MGVYEFMKDAEYKAILKEYVEALEKREKQVKADVQPKRIKDDTDKAVRSVTEKIRNFYNKRMADIQKKKHEIEQSYKKTGMQYDNPQAELLKRQDFEAEIAVATNDELKNIVNDPERDFSKYELNKLQIEFKERNLTGGDITLKQRQVKNEYATDPNYQRLLEEEGKLYLTKPRIPVTDTWVLYPNMNGGERPEMKSLKELTSNRPIVRVDELKQAYTELERHISDNDSYKASFKPILASEVKQQADELIKTGEYKNMKKYTDIDLRAVQGSSEYAVENEFKYLKERYHDPSNKFYTFENPDYSIHDHFEYLRQKHQQHLKVNPALQKEIEEKLQADQAAQKAE